MEDVLKVAIVGNSGVGKTCLVDRAVRGLFDPGMPSTAGALSATYCCYVDELCTQVNLNIWDTAGQEVYRSITPYYLRGACGVIVAFAVNNRTAFEEVPRWMELVQDNCPGVPVVLTGTKCDEDRTVSAEEGMERMAAIKASYYVETSAATGQNVIELFGLIARLAIQDANKLSAKKTVRLDKRHEDSEDSCC
jgi:small GTP-binding protein